MKENAKQAKLNTVLNTEEFGQLFLPVAQSKDNIQGEQGENTLVRPEMHMFLRPYFLLDKHADRTQGIETRELVNVKGRQIERRWCVKPDNEYGMPGPIERDVLLVLYEIAYERYLSKGIPIPEMMPTGSTRSFLKRLGLSNCGQSAASVKLALKRLVHTTCKSENSFFDKTKNLFLTKAFQLLRGVGIVGETDGKGDVIEETFVSFDEHIRNNLNARYLMVLDLHYMRSLKTDMVKHLYPLLSHWLWRSSQQGYWRVEYQWLAQHLGIKVWDKLWRAKKQLEVANEELKEKQYIAHYEWDEWNILYFPGAIFKAEQERRITAKMNTQEISTAKPHGSKEVIDHDPLFPVLSLFAKGVPLAESLLEQRGLTIAQAEALCLERGIQPRSSASSK